MPQALPGVKKNVAVFLYQSGHNLSRHLIIHRVSVINSNGFVTGRRPGFERGIEGGPPAGLKGRSSWPGTVAGTANTMLQRETMSRASSAAPPQTSVFTTTGRMRARHGRRGPVPHRPVMSAVVTRRDSIERRPLFREAGILHRGTS